MEKISVVLITLNEEKCIERCLRSVRWADEIIVVDSFSTDRTVELAGTYTNRVFQHEYQGSTRQMERGIGYALSDWILFLDADEEVSEDLSLEIQEILAHGTPMTGFQLARKPKAFGRWMKHGGWFPDYQLRLVRKDSYRVQHEEVHGGFTATGRAGRLRGYVYHYTYETIYDYVAKMNDYTSLHVSNRLKGSLSARTRWYSLILSPASHFLRMFISRKGYRDGFHGFVLALLDATYSMLLYAKLWEYRMCQEDRRPLPPITNAELNKLKRIS